MAGETARKPIVVSTTYALKRKEGVGEGLRRIARGRAEKARSRLEGALDGEDPVAAIHGARKDFKKLRAALRLGRYDLDRKAAKRESRRFREAGRVLSASRDAEVRLQALNALEEHCPAELGEGSVQLWRRRLAAEAETAKGIEGGRLEGALCEALRMSEAGAGAIAGWDPDEQSSERLAKGLRRIHRRGRKALKRTLAEPSAESVHGWRKRAKDLWYALRILEEAWPPVLGASAGEAHRLAELLGDHHDLALLRDDLAQREELAEREELDATIDRRQRQLLTEALELGRRIYAEPPKAAARRIESYRAAWRQD